MIRIIPKSISKKAFSLIELSVVLIIISALIVAITKASDLIYDARLASAKTLTANSPIFDISDLILWLEPTLKNSFGVEETGDNQTISSWYDSSGNIPNNKMTAAQNTTANKPLYKKQGVNNLPSLYFDGVNDFLSITNNNYVSISGSFTIFTVFKPMQNGSSNISVGILAKDIAGTTTNTPYEIFYNESTKKPATSITFNSSTNIENLSVNSIEENDSAIITTIFDQNNFSQNFAIYLNGNRENSSTVINSISLSTGSLNIGKTQSSASNNFFKGQIAEIIIYNRALNDQEKEDVEHYLANKWGIEID